MYPSQPSAYPSNTLYPSGPGRTNGAVALSGAGTLSPGTPTAGQPNRAALSGAGTLGLAPTMTYRGAAALAGVGTLSPAGVAVAVAAVSLSATSALSIFGIKTGPLDGAAYLFGTGTLASIARVDQGAAVLLAGEGVLALGVIAPGATYPGALVEPGPGLFPSTSFGQTTTTTYPGPTTFPGTATFPGTTAGVGAGGTGPSFLEQFATVALSGTGTFTDIPDAGATVMPGAYLFGTSKFTVTCNTAPLVPPTFVPSDIDFTPQPPRYRLYVADTITGKIAFEVPVSSLSWEGKLNGIGTLQATLDIDQTYDALSDQDERDPRVLFRQFLYGPYRYSLVLAYGEQAVWGGPYLPGTVPPNSPTVQLGAAEFPSLLSKRLMVQPNVDPASAAADVTLGPYSKPGLALALMQFATSKGASYRLPWTCLTPPVIPGVETRIYRGYDLTTAWDALFALMSEEDGPDIRFDPYLFYGSDGLYVRYDMRIGEPRLSRPLEWAWDSPDNSFVQWDTNVTNLATIYYGVGAGQDQTKLISTATNSSLSDIGWPAMEMIDSLHSSETDARVLAALTTDDMRLYQSPAVKWTMHVQGDRDPKIGVFRVGDPFQITIRDHTSIPDGTFVRRITALSGDLSDWVYLSSSDDYVAQSSSSSSAVQTITN